MVENVGESIHGNLLFDEEELHILVSVDSKLCGAVWIDIGHAVLNRWNLERVIKELNGRICSYHLHNNDGSGDTHRPLFEKNLLLGKRSCPINSVHGTGDSGCRLDFGVCSGWPYQCGLAGTRSQKSDFSFGQRQK